MANATGDRQRELEITMRLIGRTIHGFHAYTRMARFQAMVGLIV